MMTNETAEDIFSIMVERNIALYPAETIDVKVNKWLAHLPPYIDCDCPWAEGATPQEAVMNLVKILDNKSNG